MQYVPNCAIEINRLFFFLAIASKGGEYDPEIAQLHTADQPMVP